MTTNTETVAITTATANSETLSITSSTSNTTVNYIQRHLDVLREHLTPLHLYNEGARRLVDQIRYIADYEENSLLPYVIVSLTAFSIVFSITLVTLAIVFPSLTETYEIIGFILGLGCLIFTATCAICHWVDKEFDPLSNDRKDFLVQIFAHLFLVFQILRFLNNLLTKDPWVFCPPGIIDSFLLWSCVNVTIMAVVSRQLSNETTIPHPSRSIYDDIQDSLVVFCVPFLMLTIITFRNLTSAISRGSMAIFRDVPLL